MLSPNMKKYSGTNNNFLFMDLTYNSDRKYLNERAVDIFIDSTKNLLKIKDNVIWALPGGRSVGNIFDLLSERDDTDWKRIHFFMADERLVPTSDRESNFRLLMERLLNPLLSKDKITRYNIHPFIYRPKENEAGIDMYERELAELGGKYDVVLLSSGEDGHIAGLYPDHDSIRDGARYFIKMDNSPKPPPMRMSSSRNLLSVCDTAVLLFYGTGKKNALDMFKDSSLTIEQCPAKLVSLIKNSYVLTDQE